MAAPPSGEAGVDERDLVVGSIMVVDGLKSSPELNGVHVEVMAAAPYDERSRVAVRVLDEQARQLLVKVVNLRARGAYDRTRPFHDLAPSLAPFLYEPSADGIETNLLILLHGLGDTAKNFVEFGRRLTLPQTSLLAITAPGRLPLDMGAAWYPAFEQDGTPLVEPVRPGDRRRVEGVRASRIAIQTLIRGLVCRCNWRASDVFIMGFSQGGLVAMDVGTHVATPGPLGGVVGLSCACLLPEQDALSERRKEESALQAPMLSLHGTQDDVVPLSLARSTRDVMRERIAVQLAEPGSGSAAAHYEYVELAGGKHATPQCAEHARPLLAFFGRHLLRRSPAMEAAAGIIEIKPGVASLSREGRGGK